MSILDFKGRAKAEKWKSDLAALNEETDQVLKNVSKCMEEIKTESSGEFVDELVTTAADLADAAVEMITALKSLEKLVDRLIQMIIKAIADAAQEIANKRTQATDLK